MDIRLVILDADGVLWDHLGLSALSLPLRKKEQDTIVDLHGEQVHLFKGVRRMLRNLVQRGIIVALATWNKPEHVLQALQLFGVDKHFRVVEARFHRNKHLMIRNILKKLADENVTLEPDQILYVDDRTIHLADIRKEIGNVHFLQMHVDVKNPLEIVDFIETEVAKKCA